MTRGLFATMLERSDTKEAIGLNRSRLRSTRPVAPVSPFLTNADDVIVAEVGPAGLTKRDGKPVTHPIKMELHFEDGKFTQAEYY